MIKRILVVDDEPDIVTLLKEILTKNGYYVIDAPNGKIGIEKAVAEKPDLILLDILMEGIDGFSVSEQLKKDKTTKDIPIIMLSALSEESDIARGLAAGAACFLAKPFNVRELLSEINQAINKRAVV